MDTPIVLLVLLAALLHASWNALVKTGPDPLLSLASLHVTAALVVIPIIFQVPLPNAECIPYLAASVGIHWLYYGLLSSAYRVGDLSHVYPLSRGIAPLLVAGVSALVAGEFLPGLTIVGIVLARRRYHFAEFRPRTSLAARPQASRICPWNRCFYRSLYRDRWTGGPPFY